MSYHCYGYNQDPKVSSTLQSKRRQNYKVIRSDYSAAITDKQNGFKALAMVETANVREYKFQS
jgi:hypothetical protein